MKIDFNKPARQVLLDLIYASNGIVLQDTNIEFGTPVALGRTTGWGLNTVLTVTADQIETDQFDGSTDLYYRRIALSDLPVYSQIPIAIPAYPVQTTDLLPQINAKYQTQMTADDVVNTVYADGSQPVILQAAPGSLCFIGSTELLVQPPLGKKLLQVNDLNGFFVARV